MNFYAVDFESYYDDEYGIQEQGVWHYIHDRRYDPYLVAIYGPEVDYVGHPSLAPWEQIAGHDWIAHNAAFDQQVYNRITELSDYPGLYRPAHWYCTANLSCFLGGPRSLKDATKHLLGREVDKGMRGYMKGKTWDDAVKAGKADALKTYARNDAVNCYEIWEKYNHLWPQFERDVAELTFQQTQRGIGVNKQLIESTLPAVYEVRETAGNLIPWKDSDKLLSPIALKAWCVDNKIDPPITTNAKDSRFSEWQTAHADVKVVKAMQDYRSSNALFMKANTLYTRIRDDGRYGFEMKYFGALTGRMSGGWEDERADSAQFNIQNLYSHIMFGLDLRKCLVPAKGHKFVIADFSQIEPRCLAWLSQDKKLLEALYEGTGLYEAHARATMGWKGGNLKKEDPKTYALAKARVLALGYGAGWAKFIIMAHLYGCDEVLNFPVENYEKNRKAFERYIDRYDQRGKMKKDPSELDWTRAINAWMIVTDFRKSNVLLKERMWETLEHDCRRSVGTDFVIELPSGRLMKYRNIKLVGGKIMGQQLMHEPHIPLWGSFLTENVTQACARDVMTVAMLNLEKEGIRTLFTVHDEIICEVEKDFPSDKIASVMLQAPSWMPGLPLDISLEECDFYKK